MVSSAEAKTASQKASSMTIVEVSGRVRVHPSVVISTVAPARVTIRSPSKSGSPAARENVSPPRTTITVPASPVVAVTLESA
jgi:hypothetical protein